MGYNNGIKIVYIIDGSTNWKLIKAVIYEHIANIGSVIYVQMRMIACCAYMMDYDLNYDQTQTFVYACLAGVTLNSTIKQAGIKFGLKMAHGLANKISGKVGLVLDFILVFVTGGIWLIWIVIRYLRNS